MAEKYHLHAFNPDKTNKFRCVECPYLANNPIHRHMNGQMIKGVISKPMKFG